MKKLTTDEILEFVQNEENRKILNKWELDRSTSKVNLNDTEIQLYLIPFQNFIKEKHEENEDLKMPNPAQILQNFAWRVKPRLREAKLKISDENVLSIPDETVVEYLTFYQEKFLEPSQKEE